VELKRAGTREERASIDRAMKISKDAKEMAVGDTGGSRHELTQDVDSITNVRACDAKIDKTTNEVMIASWIVKRNIVSGTKTSVKLHRSVHKAVISNTCMIKKIMNVLSLGELVPLGVDVTSILRKLDRQEEHLVSYQGVPCL
jgi:hypothetical protein